MGLKPGTYTLKVTTKTGTYTQSGIEVNAQDRSGYAHYNYTDGVGAYNDDGTLKDNAIVLYVTDENKNTVTLSYGGVTVALVIFLTQSVRHVVKQVMRQSVRRYRKERHITARVILIRVFSSYLLRIIYH